MVNLTEYCGDAAGWDATVESLGGGFYQCYGWGEVRRVAGWQPRRLLVSEYGRSVAAASVLVRRQAGITVCWIPGGPAGPIHYFGNQFRKCLPGLLNSRLVYCRMSILREGAKDEYKSLASNGWNRPSAVMSSGLTMLYSLERNESERLKLASGNWRHNLKRSNRYGLNIEYWERPNASEISALYREMEQLKAISVQHSEAELESMLLNLGDHIAIFRCCDAEGSLLAIRAAGIFGNTGWDLLAAASAAARKVYASHATLWALFEHCHQKGLAYYDLSGVDPVGNKGVYDFKHGTGASKVECLGEWEWGAFGGICYAVNWALARRSKQ